MTHAPTLLGLFQDFADLRRNFGRLLRGIQWQTVRLASRSNLNDTSSDTPAALKVPAYTDFARFGPDRGPQDGHAEAKSRPTKSRGLWRDFRRGLRAEASA